MYNKEILGTISQEAQKEGKPMTESTFTITGFREDQNGNYVLLVLDDTRADLSILGIQGYDEQGKLILSQINNQKVEVPLWVGKERYVGNDTIITKPIPRKGQNWYRLDRSQYTRDFSRVLLWTQCRNPVIDSINDESVAVYSHFKTITFVNGSAEAKWGGKGHIY